MTKRIYSILILLFTVCSVTQGQEPAGFAELRGEYEKALERIERSETKELDNLKEQYVEALDRGIVHYMRRGDLKSTLALRDERERFEEHDSIRMNSELRTPNVPSVTLL